jgi:hypothetical protein
MPGAVVVDDASPGSDPGQGAEEFLELGHSRAVPQWLGRLARITARIPRWVLLVALAVTVTITLVETSRPTPRAANANPSNVISINAALLQSVQSLAGTPDLAPYHLRPDVSGCPLPHSGYQAKARLTAALRRQFPGRSLTNLTVTLDQLGAICNVTARSIGPHGVDIVISIAAPKPATKHSTAWSSIAEVSGQNGQTVVLAESSISTGGYEVLVGAVGPARYRPDTEPLRLLALDPGLTW